MPRYRVYSEELGYSGLIEANGPKLALLRVAQQFAARESPKIPRKRILETIAAKLKVSKQ